MTFIGRIDPFNENEEDWPSYAERLAQFLVVNGVADEKKTAALISLIGPKLYKLLKSLTAPDNPSTKAYTDLVKLLTDHLSPKPLVISERFKFYKRDQKDNDESISEYLAELRRLANTCEFGTFLNEALRDRLVCGLKAESIQKRLLTEADLTLDKAVKISVASETAAKDAGLLNKASGASAAVNKINPCPRKPKGRGKGKGTQGQGSQSAPGGRTSSSCYRCGGSHDPTKCKYKTYKCNSCGITGHLAKSCRNNQGQGSENKYVSNTDQFTHEETEISNDDTQPDHLGMFAVGGNSPPIKVKLGVNDIPVVFEVDTGAAKSILPEEVYRKDFAHVSLQKCSDILTTYSGDQLRVLGQSDVTVTYNGQRAVLPIVVVQACRNQPPLLGRNWLKVISLDWQAIFTVMSTVPDKVQGVCSKHDAVFQKELGTMTEQHTAKLYVCENTKPKFHKARPVPYALKPAINAKLDELIALGILEPVTHSEWAAPCVIVPKANNSVRICGDYKVTINPYLDVDKYPLPTPQDLFATLAGGKYFTTLDLSQAYHQMKVDKDSRKYLTINTHRGLMSYTRLPYGIASAPSLFQNAMDQVLQGMEGVICYIDDILITGKDEAEHLERLEAVLARLESNGLRLQLAKCKFMETSVEYLGHVISADGIAPTPDNVSGITEVPKPTNVNELRSFLGMVQYYSKFIPNLADMVHPLNALLGSHTPYKWTKECDDAFEAAKAQLLSDTVLTHYDVTKPLILACDASPYGVGAVLSHIMENGEERPVAYASRTLTSAEKNYAQLQKEALALIFGVKKYHQYLYGRGFTLVTDHKPLLSILGPKSGVPTLAAARLQRWAIILSAYRYDIKFKSTGEHYNADALSRLPACNDDTTAQDPNIFHFNLIDELPVTAEEIATETRKDPLLSRVYEYTLSGWPAEVSENLKPYENRKNELSIECGVVLWGLRVCIPSKLQSRILIELHDQHQGITRMKSLARGYFWWAKLDADIEQITKSCNICASVKNRPPLAPLFSWKWATRRFERVHLDFATKEGKNFLVLKDAYSKWIDVIIVPNITTQTLVEVLRPIFASHGFPELLVTDNGPAFISADFERFCKLNGIAHKLIPPYHAATNGAAERSVQILKQALATSKDSGLTLQHRVANFLLVYRNTPHATTGCTPAELFLKCQPRIRLTLIKPSIG